MSGIIINPGSGPVENASEFEAAESIRHFAIDCGENIKVLRVSDEDDRGRFGFLLWDKNRCALIQMPGLPLERVRYMGEPQNIYDFPRLYVDGSSWTWVFAINTARSALGIETSDDEERRGLTVPEGGGAMSAWILNRQGKIIAWWRAWRAAHRRSCKHPQSMHGIWDKNLADATGRYAIGWCCASCGHAEETGICPSEPHWNRTRR